MVSKRMNQQHSYDGDRRQHTELGETVESQRCGPAKVPTGHFVEQFVVRGIKLIEQL